MDITGLTYIDDIITIDEELFLISTIDNLPWNTQLKRRTQHYGYTYDYNSSDISNNIAEPIPEWCNFLIDRLLERGILKVRPDQMIVNEYEPGQGIYPHVDNIKTFDNGIVSVSLSSDITMNLINKEDKRDITLKRRSVICFYDDARYIWRHGITPRKSDNKVKRNRRISLTFRKIINI